MRHGHVRGSHVENVRTVLVHSSGAKISFGARGRMGVKSGVILHRADYPKTAPLAYACCSLGQPVVMGFIER